MNYSSIVVPVIALAIWYLLVWLMSLPPTLRLVFADDFDPPLTEEERQRNAERESRRHRYFQSQPVPFYVLCIALAYTGKGSGLDSWLAWVFAVSWAASKLPETSSNKHLRCGTGLISIFSLYALAIHAGIRVTRDLLTA